MLKTLRRRFKITTNKINAVRAEVVGPVSEELEKDIEDYLKSVPEYAAFPFIHFRVQTNNSFDRVNFMNRSWGFLPVGNDAAPLMFACDTGRGDGCYDVICGFSQGLPRQISVSFINTGS